MDHPAFIVCSLLENSIGLKWVNMESENYQTLVNRVPTEIQKHNAMIIP